MLVSRVRLCAPGQPPQIDKKRLESLFARMTVISNLCQSRLALPLHYPLHARQLGREEDEKNPIASSKWSEEEVKQTLAAVEEKFGEQNFRVFSEMQGKFWCIDPKNFKKSHQNQPKCRENAVKIWKSTSENPMSKFEIGTSKPLTLNPKIGIRKP